MAIAESTILEDLETGKVKCQCLYFKPKALENHKIDGIDKTLKNGIALKKAIVFSDQSISYVNIADYVEIYLSKNRVKKQQKKPSNGSI